MPSTVRIKGNQNITFGAVELNGDFGQAQSGSLTHLVDEEKIDDALGNAQALVQNNERYEFEAETVWDETAVDPAIGDLITLPNGKVGIIQEAKKTWAKDGSKAFSIKAVHHVSLGDAPNNGNVSL
jgi:hypothetical protein